MIQRDEQVVELRTITYTAIDDAGGRFTAVSDAGGFSLRYEGIAGSATIALPAASLPVLSDLLASAITDTQEA